MRSAAGHYIPEFYLKGFTEKKGLLWVHEKYAAPRASTPKREANKPDYYALSHEALDSDALEKMYSRTESIVAPAILKSRNPLFLMTDEDAGNIRAFIALSFTRVPHFIDFVKESQIELAKKLAADIARKDTKFEETVAKVNERFGTRIDTDEARETFVKGDYELSHKNNDFALASVMRVTQKIIRILVEEFEHDLLYAPEGSSFITTDTPVMTLINQRDGSALFGPGFAHQQTEVFFPLNKRAAMHLRRGATRQKLHVSASRVDEINRALMGWGQSFMYASSGNRRIGRLFTQYAGAIKFGKTALLHSMPTSQ
ncbi:DUF4238 domain-containing protein [Granulicella sp. S190]|uniref:DUF4238 domain-containing protein n=1 Tax=Granulicella sp. S190 TaxID=1747226 RepID=UPI00131D39EE|nr:DUF4238 domain-containing protein [Granulicella sp. S190]